MCCLWCRQLSGLLQSKLSDYTGMILVASSFQSNCSSYRVVRGGRFRSFFSGYGVVKRFFSFVRNR